MRERGAAGRWGGALVALLVVGCGPRLTPLEELELLRSQYAAELKSMSVLQDPDSGDASEGEQEDSLEAPAGLDLDQPPVRTDILLDILVSTTAQEYLAGVTIDLEHVDGERNVKSARRTLWVDTSTLVRGGGTQVTHVLEDVDYEPGDGFAVEIRNPVPEAERAEYREYSDL